MRFFKGILSASVMLVVQGVAAQEYRAPESADSLTVYPLGSISSVTVPTIGSRLLPNVGEASMPMRFLNFSPSTERALRWLDVRSSMESMPGLMGIESVTASTTFNIGRLTFQPQAHAIKYGYLRGLQTSYGIGATIDYQINDRLSVTAFGTYFTPVTAPSPAVAGFMQTSRIGGYATWRMSERWSLSAGAQAVYSPYCINKWQAVPVLVPTYHVNSKVALGVDVGGILYNIAESIIENQRSNSGPAPIGPNMGEKRDMFSGGDPSKPRWNK